MRLSENECKEVIAKLVELQKDGWFSWEQFNYCNAYTTKSIASICTSADQYLMVRPIKSYNTIVGFADIRNHIVYECGKYSRTTSKQFTQICNQIFKAYDRVLAYK